MKKFLRRHGAPTLHNTAGGLVTALVLAILTVIAAKTNEIASAIKAIATAPVPLWAGALLLCLPAAIYLMLHRRTTRGEHAQVGEANPPEHNQVQKTRIEAERVQPAIALNPGNQAVEEAQSGKIETPAPFELQIMSAIFQDKSNEALGLLEEWDQKEPDKKEAHAIIYHGNRCWAQGDEESFAELNKIYTSTTDEANRIAALQEMVLFYKKTDRPKQALDCCNTILSTAKDEKDKAEAIAQSCRIHLENKDPQTALSTAMLGLTRSDINSDRSRSALFRQVAAAYQELGNPLGQCAALEKVVELQPTNTEDLFAAGFAQGTEDLPLLSFVNYRKRLQIERKESTTLNNLGVTYATLGMPSLAIASYTKSKDEGNSLAMSNLANLYIDKGFLAQAEELLRSAQTIANYDSRVDTSMTRLRAQSEEDQEKLKRTQAAATEFKKFFRNFANAFFDSSPFEPEEFGGIWICDKFSTELIVANAELSGTWETPSEKFRMQGTITGRAARLRISKDSSTFSYLLGGSHKALAYISSDGDSIYIHSYGDEQDPLLPPIELRRHRSAN